MGEFTDKASAAGNKIAGSLYAFDFHRYQSSSSTINTDFNVWILAA